jgi:hypothetical protein
MISVERAQAFLQKTAQRNAHSVAKKTAHFVASRQHIFLTKNSADRLHIPCKFRRKNSTRDEKKRAHFLAKKPHGFLQGKRHCLLQEKQQKTTLLLQINHD